MSTVLSHVVAPVLGLASLYGLAGAFLTGEIYAVSRLTNPEWVTVYSDPLQFGASVFCMGVTLLVSLYLFLKPAAG
ncbi:hypothetical protein [Jiella marina]|uniref:hypothetical protein n=1 Tax=Jiella sp. LLJ827 TaxID=2917712 RepID=UPI002101AD70|nr:hypothetical protein [Jiella sp. LLJ827]MCQ0988009.1 hypothetical protein [Jiella sp. LLJ827]